MMDRDAFITRAWRCLFTSGICDVRVAVALARYAFDLAASAAELRCPACGRRFHNIHGLRNHAKNSRRCRSKILGALHKAYEGYASDTWIATARAEDLAVWLASHGALPKWWSMQFRRGIRKMLSLRTRWR